MVYWKSKRLQRYFYSALNDPDNLPEKESCMKRGVSLSPFISLHFIRKVSVCGVKGTIAQPYNKDLGTI